MPLVFDVVGERDIYYSANIGNSEIFEKPDRETKVRTLKKFPLLHVGGYLGLTSYFRRFIEVYAGLTKSLSDLLRLGTKFTTSEQTVAFQ